MGGTPQAHTHCRTQRTTLSVELKMHVRGHTPGTHQDTLTKACTASGVDILRASRSCLKHCCTSFQLDCCEQTPTHTQFDLRPVVDAVITIIIAVISLSFHSHTHTHTHIGGISVSLVCSVSLNPELLRGCVSEAHEGRMCLQRRKAGGEPLATALPLCHLTTHLLPAIHTHTHRR